MLINKLQNIDPEKIAIIYDNNQISYRDLLKTIAERASLFNSSKKGYLLSNPNELENLLNFLAIISIGGKAVFASKKMPKSMLFAEENGLEILDKLPKQNEQNATNHQPVLKYSDIFLGILSSGSTGKPKLIWKDYQSWFSAFDYQSEIFGISSQDKVFVLDAFSYSANLNTALHALWQGASLVISSLKKAKNWPQQLEDYAVSSVFLVPSHYKLLLAAPKKNYAIKSMVCAGEKLPAATAQLLLATYPNVLLTEYYGAAELGHISYHQNQDIIKNPYAVGKPFPGVEIKIENQKIWVNSPYISPDYRSNPTVEDFGFFENPENLVLLGRTGRMFNKRGLNIYAEEIENVIITHPVVQEAVAVQSQNSKKNICLFIKLKPNETYPGNNSLRDYLLQKLPPEKIPNQFILVNDIPRNQSGKVDFQVLAKKPSSEDPAFIIA
jgi:long-chain acyl-CoA synthetase